MKLHNIIHLVTDYVCKSDCILSRDAEPTRNGFILCDSKLYLNLRQLLFTSGEWDESIHAISPTFGVVIPIRVLNFHQIDEFYNYAYSIIFSIKPLKKKLHKLSR